MRRILTAFLLALSFTFGESYTEFFLVDRVFLTPFVLKYADELGLDGDQIEKIKGFIKESEREVRSKVILLRHMEKRARLMILSGDEEEKIKEVLSDIASLKIELSLINARSVRFLKETLTPAQFDKLKDMVLVRLLEFDR
ncbi:MAG TPA: hypothetical protein EYH49_00315 [Aquifex aeolicus]|nr:hypothetical protein [Aquifex aeolicus]